MLLLEVGSSRFSPSAPGSGETPLAEQVVLVAIMQRVLEQLDFDICQGILEELQPGFDGRHVIFHQLVTLRADQAKLVIEDDGVEPADAAILEKLLDPNEIFIGAVGQVFAAPRTRGKGWWPALART